MAKRTIGEFLAILRKSRGYTQQQAADLLGVSNRTVSAWETDRAYPDITILPEIAALYGTTADEIIRGEHAGECVEPERDAVTQAQYRRALTREGFENIFAAALGICGAAIMFILALIGSIETVAAVLFSVLAVAVMAAACVLFTVFYKKTLSSAAVFPQDGALTQRQKNFIFIAVGNSLRSLFVCGAVWLLCGMLTFAIIAITNPYGNGIITGGAYKFTVFGWSCILVPVIAGVAAIYTSRLKYSAQVKKYCGEEVRGMQKYNDRLLLKCSAVAACPIIALTVLIFMDAALMVKDNVFFIVAGLISILAIIAIASFFYYRKRKKFNVNL